MFPVGPAIQAIGQVRGVVNKNAPALLREAHDMLGSAARGDVVPEGFWVKVVAWIAQKYNGIISANARHKASARKAFFSGRLRA